MEPKGRRNGAIRGQSRAASATICLGQVDKGDELGGGGVPYRACRGPLSAPVGRFAGPLRSPEPSALTSGDGTVPPPVAVVVFLTKTGQAWDRKIMAPGSWSPLTRSGPDCGAWADRNVCPTLARGPSGPGTSVSREPLASGLLLITPSPRQVLGRPCRVFP